MKIRDRIVGLRRVRAGDLLTNPRNWRTHPESQSKALAAVLDEVGIAGALIGYETPEGIQLIDGHLRQEQDPDQEWPVLVLDVDEAEADKLLATLDPLAAMAGADTGVLDDLLKSIETDSDELQKMLDDLAGAGGEIDMGEEWEGMPEFEHEDKTAFRSIHVHFKDQDAVDEFTKRLKQTVTEKTRFIWYPKIEIETYADKQYA